MGGWDLNCRTPEARKMALKPLAAPARHLWPASNNNKAPDKLIQRGKNLDKLGKTGSPMTEGPPEPKDVHAVSPSAGDL